jgi:hypothetical protein
MTQGAEVWFGPGPPCAYAAPGPSMSRARDREASPPDVGSTGSPRRGAVCLALASGQAVDGSRLSASTRTFIASEECEGHWYCAARMMTR